MSVNQIFNICDGFSDYPSVLKPVKRIVALGDIHGDFDYLIQLLKIAMVIDNNNHWIGGNTHIVQLGDQIDNCRPYYQDCREKDATPNDKSDDLKIIEYLDDLDVDARTYGGRVISLIGNHELMNINGDMSYVSYENTNSVGGIEQRKHLFSSKGTIGQKIMCTHPPAVIIGSNLFAHAGIVPQLIDELPEIRKLLYEHVVETIKHMDSQNVINLFINCVVAKKIDHKQMGDFDPEHKQYWKELFETYDEPSKIIKQISDNTNILQSFLKITEDLRSYLIKHIKIFNIDDMNPLEIVNTTIRIWLFEKINKKYLSSIETLKSLFWNRILGSIPNEKHKNVSYETCDNFVKPVLKFLNINHMVVGHTPQYMYNQSGINSSCDGSVYKVDIGGSNTFDKFDSEFEKSGNRSKNRMPQVLVIDDDVNFRVLYDEKYNSKMHGGKMYNLYKHYYLS